VSLLLAAAACPEANPGCFPEELPLRELFEFRPFLFEDSLLFQFNRTSMLYLLAGLITIGLMMAAFNNARIVPGKFQAAMEGLVDIVRTNIVPSAIGPDGARFVPLLTSIFLFVFVNNFFEIMPFVNFPSTGRMALPAMLAIMVWTVFILVGLKAQGPRYFVNAVKPPGVPAPILLLIIPIEIISTFVVRPLTLSVRLFANMMAGHILLTVVFLAANAFFIDFHDLTSPAFNLKGLPIGLIAIAGSVGLVAFELLVGFLQAYIFTILTAVYIGSSMHPEH
jgi:F-type H+-transporting ATPase subunit a